MPKSVFVVGIGGTGMRCIESFVHLCAIGMFDDTEVHLLAMDTDKDNGNFRRLATLVDNYKKSTEDTRKARHCSRPKSITTSSALTTTRLTMRRWPE